MSYSHYVEHQTVCSRRYSPGGVDVTFRRGWFPGACSGPTSMIPHSSRHNFAAREVDIRRAMPESTGSILSQVKLGLGTLIFVEKGLVVSRPSQRQWRNALSFSSVTCCISQLRCMC